jgi:hypothetical protein
MFPTADFEKFFVDSAVLLPFVGVEKAFAGIQLFQRDPGTSIADAQMENDPGDNVQKDRLERLECDDSHVSPFIILNYLLLKVYLRGVANHVTKVLKKCYFGFTSADTGLNLKKC